MATVDKNLIYKHSFEDASKRNLDIYYFNVTVKNLAGSQSHYVNSVYFKLEDNEGNTYQNNGTQDSIHGDIGIGKKVSGGLAFRVNKGNYPVRLVYDTRYVITMTGENVFSYLDVLPQIAVIKSFNGPLIPQETQAQNSHVTGNAEAEEAGWFIITGRKCEDDEGPAVMIANLQKGGLQYKTEDLKKENGKPVIVKIEIFEQLGSTSNIYYRGKETCQAEITEDKKTKEAELDKYR